MDVQRRHIDAIWAFAAGASAEICGVLIGQRWPVMTLHAIIPARNVHPTPQHQFLLDADTLLQADAQARAAGGEIIGFYHSHPSGRALLSPHDRRDAWMDYVYLIVAVERGAPRYLCAWRCHTEGLFGPEPILPLPDDYH